MVFSCITVRMRLWGCGWVPMKLERRHDVRYDMEFVSRGCRNEYTVSHKQSINLRIRGRSRGHWRQLVISVRKPEYQTRLSCEYNWNAEPTKCCERKRGMLWSLFPNSLSVLHILWFYLISMGRLCMCAIVIQTKGGLHECFMHNIMYHDGAGPPVYHMNMKPHLCWMIIKEVTQQVRGHFDH